jgi:hypothetical protein
MMRAVARVGVTAGVALAAVWLTATAALAHGTVNVTIHSDGTGSVWTTLVWSDGHPVSEPATAILLATSTDGRRVGPVGLTVAGTPGILAYASRLDAGQWRLTVDVATPGLGHCEADITIAATQATPGPPTETICAAQTPTAVAAQPGGAASSGAGATLLVVLGVVAAAAATAALAWRSRQARRPPPRRTRGARSRR